MCRAVAHARRHADHGASCETADEARERAVHPRDYDDAVGSLEIGKRGGEPVHARDAHVLVDDDGRPEKLRANSSLAHDRAVGSSRGDDRDNTTGLGNASCDPDATSERVLLSLRRDLANSRARRIFRACGENASGSPIEKRHEDLRNLVGRLAFGEHRFGSALAKLAMDVHAREAEVAIRELRESLERVVRARLTDSDALEELAEIIPKAGHRAIVSASGRRYGRDSPARTEQAEDAGSPDMQAYRGD